MRIGQDKMVHVWTLHCSNSFADAMINTGALRKLRIIDRIMDALRTPKDGSIRIPDHIPQYGRIGYTPYKRYNDIDEEALRRHRHAHHKALEEATEEVNERPPASKRARLSPGAYAEQEDMAMVD